MDKMIEEAAAQLLEELSGYGMQKEGDYELLQCIRDNMPHFTLHYTKAYEQERMRFEIQVTRVKGGYDGYAITDIKAFYRDVVHVNAGTISDVDTAALDEKMGKVNWEEWFKNEGSSGTMYVPVNEIISSLAQLFNSDDENGRSAQQLLIYKHWPPEYFDLHRKQEGKDWERIFESAHSFNSDPHWFSADLAYLVASGRAGRLLNAINKIVKNAGNEFSFRNLPYDFLRNFPQQFELSQTVLLPTEQITFSIPLAWQDGDYIIHPYSASVIQYPKVPDGSYVGINCPELDRRMSEVNWSDSEALFLPDSGDVPVPRPDVSDILWEHDRLSKDPEGVAVADLLAIKYFQKSPLFENRISPAARDLLQRLPRISHRFATDMPLKKAINQLRGKAVFYPVSKELGLGGHLWAKLDLTQKLSYGKYREVEIVGPNREDLERMLLMLLVNNSLHHGYQHRLLDGERISVENEAGQWFQVEAHPEENCLKVFTMDGQPIPFNFHLDPGFTQQQDKIAVSNEEKAKKDTGRNKRLKP